MRYAMWLSYGGEGLHSPSQPEPDMAPFPRKPHHGHIDFMTTFSRPNLHDYMFAFAPSRRLRAAISRPYSLPSAVMARLTERRDRGPRLWMFGRPQRTD